MTSEQFIKELDKARGSMSKYQWAKLSGTSQTTIANMLRQGNCELRTLLPLALALGCEIKLLTPSTAKP